MRIICIIEETPKIFTLLKNIILSMQKEKYIFIDGEAFFSKDVEKNISEDCVLIFQLVNFAESDCFSSININSVNLAFIGDISGKIDISRFNCIDSVILNAENSDKIINAEKAKQIITCGLKEKDTVTFSSIEEDNIILNLQRTIRNIESIDIEPFERKIYIKDIESIENIEYTEDIHNKEASEVMHEDLITALTILLFCDML